MSRQTPTAQFHQKLKTLDGKYLLGDEIGKGAYGRVYKGVDLENGDFVAIKQVSLLNIVPEDLASIMQEIDLLKNLNHKNIVKYLGSYKTNSHLYIILEYVENGSLASIIKPNKFGTLPETLVAVYIAQVLEGLVYLHEQGVIHRDIKGANILTTKEGLVKLADFGVATKLSEADNNTDAVVGTPYWMAPEVIVMSGVSAASDIWSMGCTVIELLTCVPPYYDLQPMTALFRIVEEEHPPIPEHLSPLITDFLHQCFRKDAKLRPDAKTLLQHPWIQNSRRSSYSSFPRRIKNTTEDLSDGTGVSSEDGDKGALKVVSEDIIAAKSPYALVSEDDAKPHTLSAELSTSSSAQSNTIGRNTPIRITRELVEKLANGKDGHVEPTVCEEVVVATCEKEQAANEVVLASASTALNLAGESLPIMSRDHAHYSEERSNPDHAKPLNLKLEKPINQKGRKLTEATLAGELSRFSDTPADGNLDDLFEEPLIEILNPKSEEASTSEAAVISLCGPSQVVAPLAENGRGNLAAKLKAKIAQKKIAGEGAVCLKKDGDDMLSALMGAGEDINAGITDLITVRTQSMEVTRLIGLLKPEEPEESVIKACQKLVAIFNECPDQKQQLVSHHGVMPFMEMLELKNNGVLQAVLQVINQLAKDSSSFQENACLVGLIPVIMSFAGPERSKELRMQAAYFVQQLCQTSSSTLQMFIACRGLPVLVGFLEPDYARYREMVHIAIDGMWQVFNLQGPTPRNDFCRIFSKNGVLIRLVNTLHSLNEATRLASAIGMSQQTSASELIAQHRSSPLESSQALSGHMKIYQTFSDQLDPSVVRLGPNGHVATGKGDAVYTQVGVPSKGPSSRMEMVHLPGQPFPNLFEHVTTDKGWSSSAQQEHPLLFKVDRENFDLGLPDSSPTDGDQTRPLLANSDAVQQPFNNQSWHSLDFTQNTEHQVYQPQQEHVQPLISLLEKDPSSRPVSGQLEYIRHLQGGLERHESILPLLHHASAIRKNNGELELLMSAFEENGKSNGTVEAPESNSAFKLSGNISSRRGAQGEGKYPTLGEATASTSGPISQPVSGMLSVSGVLNGRPCSATSSGLLSRMVSTLNADVAREYLEKVADLLLEFSHGDPVVKSHMCGLSLLIRLFQILNKLEPPILLKILKCIKRLSKDPCTLEQLQRADAIKHLIPFLEWREGPLVSQMHNQVLKALYNLCKINKKRQEHAAECGIIPHLMHLIKVNSPLKKFALPLLCDMAHASRYTREQLRANKGVELYLDLLDVKDWAVTALDSLAVCLALDNEQRKVEQVILKADAVRKLVGFFRSCSEQYFVHILEPYLKIITKSPRINVNLATSGLIPTLVDRLDHQDAIARLNLLKLIKAVYEHHPRPKQLIVEYDLQQKLHQLTEERRSGDHLGGQVLVKQMATSLLKALHINCVL